MVTEFPRIEDVYPLPDYKLHVEFTNGVSKIYDCVPLLNEEPFRLLRDEVFFRCVRADSNGFGVVWDEKTDLAESELWLHGEITENIIPGRK